MGGPADTAIGVDVGGTRIRVARMHRDGRLADRRAEPVARDRAGFTAQLVRLVAALRDETTMGVGIGIPGRVDGRDQTIHSAGYLDIAGLDLPALLTAELNLPARVENDATMALVAEGDARPEGAAGIIAMATIGTGIGGAVLADGAPWYGSGFAGQFGHIVVDAGGPPCNCGRTGCVETFSSGTALGGLVAAAGLPAGTTAESLLAAAARGDRAAAALVEAWAAPLQRALETLVSAIDPRLILVGGGLGAAMAEALARLPRRSRWFDLPVEPARLGDEAGVIGAALCGFAVPAAARGLAS